MPRPVELIQGSASGEAGLAEHKIDANLGAHAVVREQVAHVDRCGIPRRIDDHVRRSVRPSRDGALRDVLESWFARYPVAHRSHLRGQLFSTRESEQCSAWWELYLHETFLRAGYCVDVSSRTPDFTIDGPGGRFHVEATARFADPDDRSRECREKALKMIASVLAADAELVRRT